MKKIADSQTAQPLPVNRPFAKRILPVSAWSLPPRYQRGVTTVLALIGGVIIWQLVAILVVRDSTLLPPPTKVWSSFQNYSVHPYTYNTILQDAVISLTRILVGFAIGSAIGLFLGAVMTSSALMRNIIEPYIEISRPLPPLAYIPLLVVWFGIGETPKILLIMIGTVPIVATSAASGLLNVPEEMLNAARSLGASELYTLVHVRIRSSLPQIITGLRIAMGVSWTSIVAAEMIASTSGLGYMILHASDFLQTELIFAGLIIIAALGLTIDYLLRRFQKLLQPMSQA